jgi:hypothetical protein
MNRYNLIMSAIQNKFLLFTSFLFLFFAFSVSNLISKPTIVISKQSAAWNLDNEKLQKYHFGFKRLQTSLLWISTIIESDIDHYKKKDLNSWMFLRFKTLSLLEPKFYEVYSFGGVYLSVVKDDMDGASYIFDKGLEIYPTDFKLLRDASYHFYLESKNYTRAFELSQIIKKHYPEKKFLIGMITKLEAENGRLEDALISLNSYQNEFPRGNFIGDKIYENRYALKAEIDLKCLNSSIDSKNCSLVDLDNNKYLKTKEGYRAEKIWKPYRRKTYYDKK